MTLTPTEQMIEWLGECERASRNHDVARLTRVLAEVNSVLDTDFAKPTAEREVLRLSLKPKNRLA